MGDDTPGQGGERIRRRILIPLGVTLVIFTAVFLLSAQRYLHRDMQHDMHERHRAVESLFLELIEQRSNLLRSFVLQAARDRDLQSAMRRGDRDRLLAAAEPMVDPLRPDGVVSHLYFINPEGRCLLRVHQPNRFGDLITRRTFRVARENGIVSSGIELGPLGTLTLRVVTPWEVDGELLGYIEAGEDIGYLVRKLSEIGNVRHLLTLRKEYLNAEGWEEGMFLFGREAQWERYASRVIVDQTLPALSPEIEAMLSGGEIDRGEVFLRTSGQVLHGDFLRIRDAGERPVAELLVMHDITDVLREFRLTMTAVISFCFLLGGGLMLTTSISVGRLETNLAAARGRLEEEILRTREMNDRLEDEVHERRLAENALAEARDELEQRVAERTGELSGILRSVEDILFAIDSSGRITLLNAGAEAFFGRTQDAYLGRKVEEVIDHPDLLGRIREALHQRRSSAQLDFRLTGPERTKDRIMQARISIIGEGEESFGGLVLVIQDVTQDREMDRLKNEFISTAAHELRTPMTVILGYSELLLSHGAFSAEEQQEFLTLIYQKAEAISTLLDDLLDLSRMEAGLPIEIRPEWVTIGEILSPPIAHYRSVARNHSFEVELAESDLAVHMDPGKIGQVMENLLNNAVKYSPAGGPVRITGVRSGGDYHVCVADRGMGMTSEQVRQAFQKFYRGDTADTAAHGTGLGLTLVKHIVEAHGGRIWLESRFGEGTTAHFTLPLSSPPRPVC